MATPGYWPSPWPGEDGGPRRLETAPFGPWFDEHNIDVVSRGAIATTMVVLREPGEVYALRHTVGPDAVSWVERIDAVTLETCSRSADLAGGPTWPGGLAAHANGSLYVVFGNHAHRLSPELAVVASAPLPRQRPYNSFVILPDGCLATKDFGGVLPGGFSAPTRALPPDGTTELLILEPDRLEVVGRTEIPESSIARLSADDHTIYVVGTESLYRATWDGTTCAIDPMLCAGYRTMDGQTYGWDPVLALGAAWFLDNGFGSERFAGTFRGRGQNTAPLHLVRIDLSTAVVTHTEVCGLPNGVIANPPLVDVARRIVVGYDSGNGVLAAFDVAPDGSTSARWRRTQNHACHPLLFADSGELVTTDHDEARMTDDVVVLDIETGAVRVRAASGSPIQSVVFPAAGWDRDFYYCSFTTIARVSRRDSA
jgi:hypothetical protein